LVLFLCMDKLASGESFSQQHLYRWRGSIMKAEGGETYVPKILRPSFSVTSELFFF